MNFRVTIFGLPVMILSAAVSLSAIASKASSLLQPHHAVFLLYRENRTGPRQVRPAVLLAVRAASARFLSSREDVSPQPAARRPSHTAHANRSPAPAHSNAGDSVHGSRTRSPVHR